MLDIRIHQFVHIKFSDGTLFYSSKLLKNYLIAQNLFEVKSSSLTIQSIIFQKFRRIIKHH